MNNNVQMMGLRATFMVLSVDLSSDQYKFKTHEKALEFPLMGDLLIFSGIAPVFALSVPL